MAGMRKEYDPNKASRRKCRPIIYIKIYSGTFRTHKQRFPLCGNVIPSESVNFLHDYLCC